ncbi:MAG: haloacid dehalogenase [Promethearchaeota archaeon]
MNLEKIIEKIRTRLDKIDTLREKVLKLSRETVRLCGESIRAVHTRNYERASNKKDLAMEKLEGLKILAENAPGFLSSYLVIAFQEYVEASILLNLIEKDAFLSPEELQVPYVPYLLGLGDVIGELRRFALDVLQVNEIEEMQRMLSLMEKIYSELLLLDYPKAIVPGLRRKVDVGRSLVEKTRGNVATAVQQQKLLVELSKLKKLK